MSSNTGRGPQPTDLTSTAMQPASGNFRHHTAPSKKTRPNTKNGRPNERDSINALLSLGRDLASAEAENSGLAHQETGNASLSQDPTGFANTALHGEPAKKKQKHTEGDAAEAPPDFWYWLPPKQSIGPWDVLCGRGGESNNFIGNKKYRKVVNDRKEEYRAIPLKQRKAKTAFVRNIVQHINNCGGRFVGIDEKSGRYFVVTMEKARKKTSQALRETKELKWLEIGQKERKPITSSKDSICPHCKQQGHKTKIAKSCLLHHEWLDASSEKANINSKQSTTSSLSTSDTQLSTESKVDSNDKKTSHRTAQIQGKPLVEQNPGGCRNDKDMFKEPSTPGISVQTSSKAAVETVTI